MAKQLMTWARSVSGMGKRSGGTEFASQQALQSYMRQHPKADASKHSVAQPASPASKSEDASAAIANPKPTVETLREVRELYKFNVQRGFNVKDQPAQDAKHAKERMEEARRAKAEGKELEANYHLKMAAMLSERSRAWEMVLASPKSTAAQLLKTSEAAARQPQAKPTPQPSQQAKPTPQPSQQAKPTPQPSQQAKPTPQPSQQAKPTPQPSQQAKPTPQPAQSIADVKITNHDRDTAAGVVDRTLRDLGGAKITNPDGSLNPQVQKKLTSVSKDMLADAAYDASGTLHSWKNGEIRGSLAQNAERLRDAKYNLEENVAVVSAMLQEVEKRAGRQNAALLRSEIMASSEPLMRSIESGLQISRTLDV